MRGFLTAALIFATLGLFTHQASAAGEETCGLCPQENGKYPDRDEH